MTAHFDHNAIRQEFPGLNQDVHGHPLVFLDTAASSQKPRCVLNALHESYEKEYANIHRGVYYLSDIATRKFEATRKKVATFIGARTDKEIIFTKSATEAINLVAYSFGETHIHKHHNIVISELEHHANIVPWQMLAKKSGAELRIIPIYDDGQLNLEVASELIDNNTALVSITHLSNALGVMTPIETIIARARKVGAKVLVDACQSVVHQRINVQELDCDFLVFSAHKLYGPAGVGVLYGKFDILCEMPPYQTGGEMIQEVSFSGTTFQPPPLRFEAGTPAISEVIAFGAAIDFLSALDWEALKNHEQKLLAYTQDQISALEGYRIIGQAPQKASVISFLHDTAHPNDIGAILDRLGIAIRTGHHCAQPLMKRLGISATARASFGIYTNKEDVDALIAGLKKVHEMMG